MGKFKNKTGQAMQIEKAPQKRTDTSCYNCRFLKKNYCAKFRQIIASKTRGGCHGFQARKGKKYKQKKYKGDKTKASKVKVVQPHIDESKYKALAGLELKITNTNTKEYQFNNKYWIPKEDVSFK